MVSFQHDSGDLSRSHQGKLRKVGDAPEALPSKLEEAHEAWLMGTCHDLNLSWDTLRKKGVVQWKEKERKKERDLIHVYVYIYIHVFPS